MKQVKTNKTLVMVFLCLFVVLISVSSASAASTVYVNATGGNDSNNGTIDHPYQTIGQGINSVDENGTVHIADGTYSGIGNTNLTITKNMNITGQSQQGTIINGNNTNWIFYINNGVTVNIQNLTLTNGSTTTGDGGAIYNEGTLTVNNSTFTNNNATYGGAISNRGTMTINNSTFTNNNATSWGGAISNRGVNMTVTGSTFIGNTATIGGGAIYTKGTMVITGNAFTNNTANEEGGAIHNGGTLTVTGSTFTNNNATNGGGAISNEGTLTVNNSTFINNNATNVGGAIYNEGTLTVNNSTFTNNNATYGGAIYNYNQGTLTVTSSTFINNNATYGGGAIYNQGTLTVTCSTFTNNTAYWNGGAIYNQGTLTVTGSTFTNNTADYGGAIDNGGTLTVTGSTFTNNNATHFYGGAIDNDGTLIVTGSTFIGNTATYGGGAIYNQGAVVNAQYNWWGSNNGPASGQISGSVNYSPWLCISIGVDPSNIVYGGNGTVIVSFNNTSDGSSIPNGVHIPDGTIVNFSSLLGTFNPTQTVTRNGTATTTFTATNAGTGNINGTTDNQIVSANITVNKASTTITVNNVTGVNGQKVNLTATLTDQNGKPIVGQAVTFNVNGKDYTVTTDNNGIATYEYIITQTMGTYSIIASFEGNNNYLPSTGTGNLTVNLINTTVTVNNVTGVNGQKVNLTATLTDADGNSIVGQTVTFNVNGKDYTAVTDGNGVATLSYTPTEAGIYTITVNFLNNTIYANSTGNATLTVKSAAYLYINTTSSNQNPKVGDTFILTYKLSNNGPDNATNVTMSFQIPSGLEFVTASVDNGTWTYNPTNRTITWTLSNVTMGDPYLYLTVKALESGNYIITPTITSETFNQNTNPLTPFTVNVQTPNNNNPIGNTGNNTTNTVNAATQTVAMQSTGMPIAGLVLAILAIFGGILPKRKQ
jgi:predicted outer membrane repeat protein